VPPETKKDLRERVRNLQARLDEAEETLRALRGGEVDAVMASGPRGDCAYTLKGEDELYRAMVQNMAEGALTLMPDGLILFSNGQFASMLGMPLDRVIGSSLHDLVAAEDALSLLTILTARVGAQAEVRLKRGAGALVPVLLAANPLLIEAAECLCLIVTDLSDLRGAEEEVDRSRRMLELVLDTIPLGVFWKDREGRYLGYNRRFLTDSGFSEQEEVTGRGDSEMPWKEQAERFRDEDRRVMETGQARIGYEKPLVGADGVRRWLRSSTVPLLDSTGAVIGVLGTHEDVTESKQAEEALRESQEGFRSVVENAPAAIFVSVRGRFRYLNPPAVSLLGAASASELLNQPVAESVHADSRAGVEEAIRQIQERKGIIIPVAQKYRRRDGTALDIEGSIVPFTYEGQPGGLVLVRDVTERKRAEEELRRYSVQLAEANEDLKRFTQIVSHDLRAPFVSLKGFSTELRRSIDTLRKPGEALLTGLPEPERAAVAQALEETIPEALRFIENSVTRMDHLTAALLRLSRAGHREFLMEKLNAGAIVQETVGSLAHEIQSRKIGLEIGPLPRITSDRAAIGQIFGNLLDNAIKYLDPQRPGRIEVSAEEATDAAVFHVRDNGRGIAEEDMDKIFQPFRRAGPEDVPGEGMGLAFVKALLNRLGGRIECHSQLDVGTTFSFMLPRVR
jgi:PAS domain S-box-containing protein